MRSRQTVNRNNLKFSVKTMLIIAYVASLMIVSAGSEQTSVSAMEQVRAGEPALFCYRNMTLFMNCTQNCTLVLDADQQVTPKTLGFDIDSKQTMTLVINMSRSPLQSERVMERTLNFYLGIESNATLQLNVRIRLHINRTQLSHELNREVNASRLTWMYWNRTRLQWTPVESHMDQNGYLECYTTHFSTWTVAETASIESPDPWDWAIYALIGTITAIAVAVTIVIVRRK